jgi:hypothetical protein
MNFLSQASSTLANAPHAFNYTPHIHTYPKGIFVVVFKPEGLNPTRVFTVGVHYDPVDLAWMLLGFGLVGLAVWAFAFLIPDDTPVPLPPAPPAVEEIIIPPAPPGAPTEEFWFAFTRHIEAGEPGADWGEPLLQPLCNESIPFLGQYVLVFSLILFLGHLYFSFAHRFPTPDHV